MRHRDETEWDNTIWRLRGLKIKEGTDGATPYAGVIYRNGKVFGTTPSGGPDNSGTDFEIAVPT